MQSLYEKAVFILTLLEQAGHQAKLAGGCVRDRLLGIEPKDYDIATEATPAQVTKIFTNRGLQVVPTGWDHGTVSVIIEKSAFEVTTLRRDIATDGRHAQVAFGRSFEEDAERRDFTINAMFEDKNGVLSDFFQGQAHLRNRRLVFVGNADARIQEDYLRLLRFLRFWARFQMTPDPEALQAMKRHVEGLNMISQERITSEIELLLQESYIQDPLTYLQTLMGKPAILTMESQPESIVAVVTAMNAIPSTQKSLCRLSFLFSQFFQQNSATKQVEKFSKLWKLSKAQGKFIAMLVTGYWQLREKACRWQQGDWLMFIKSLYDHPHIKNWQISLVEAWKALALQIKFSERKSYLNHCQQLLDWDRQKGHLCLKTMPINGKTLLERTALPPGPSVARALSELQYSFLAEEWQTEDEGLAWWKKKKRESVT